MLALVIGIVGLGQVAPDPMGGPGAERLRSSMLCLTERVIRYSILVTMPEGYDADAMVAGLTDGLDRIPTHLLRSIIFDQGSEWANWKTIADSYKIKCLVL